jgi:hemoglobin-like flavoprotein
MLQIELLESSFAKIEPKLNDFATSFYDNLFEMYPEAKPLFDNTNMEAQKQKLIESLRTVILNIRYAESLTELLKGLGTRHVQYGALPEHYPAVGNALLQTFADYLKSEWTPEIKEAWVEAYNAITSLMLEGANYSQEQVSLDNISGVEKEANLTAEIPAVSPEKEAENKQTTSAYYQQENSDNADELEEQNEAISEAEDSEESLSNNDINWGIIGGIAAIIIIGLIAVLVPKFQANQSPSSPPNETNIK